MKRRSYVAATVALAVGGCLGIAEEQNGSGTDDGTDDFGEDVDPIAVEAGTYDAFEDLDDWIVAGGSLEADDERVVTGSQSARLSASEGDDRASLVFAPESPLDVTGYAPGLAVSSEDDDFRLRVRLHDRDGGFLEYRSRVVADAPFDRQPFGIEVVSGDPSLEEVSRIEVTRFLDGESDAELWLDDLHFVPTPDPGAVMIHFDGGYETDYTRALPILEEHDVPATTFVTPDRLREDEDDEGDRLTEDQLETLATAGWTIGSHSDHGLPLTAVSDAAADVADAANWLEDNGYAEGAPFFSYPAGEYDSSIYDHVAERHDVAFAGSGYAHGIVADLYRVPRVLDPDAETARDAIDLTAELGGITSIVFYELDDESASVLAEAAERLSNHESDGSLSIVTPAALTDEYEYEPAEDE